MKKFIKNLKGKKVLSLLLALIMVLSVASPALSPIMGLVANAAEAVKDHYLFAYFTGDSSDGQTIHLAVSPDGLTYEPLNDNKPVIIPSKGTGAVRDPYIWYDEQDEYYYIIGTDMDAADNEWWGNSNGFLLWRSRDLVNWHDETFINVYDLLLQLGKEVGTVYRAWAPQILWDAEKKSYIVYFAIDTDNSELPANELSIVYFRTTNLMDSDAYYDFGGIYHPGSDVNDPDIIYSSSIQKWCLFYKPVATEANPVTKINMLVSDNPIGPYESPVDDDAGLEIFPDVTVALEGGNGFFDNAGNFIMYADAYGDGAFYVARTSDFNTWTLETSHNINSLSPRHGSVVKITETEYESLLENSDAISSSSFPETESLEDHLVGRYFTTSNPKYNAATGKEDLTIYGDMSSSSATGAVFNGNNYAKISLANLVSDGFNYDDGFTITFTAKVNGNADSRFYSISDSSNSTNFAVDGSATNNDKTHTTGTNLADDTSHDYIISYANGNIIIYKDGELLLKKNRFNDGVMTDAWYDAISNGTLYIGALGENSGCVVGRISDFCIYDCSMSYYDVLEVQEEFAAEDVRTKISVPETIYMTPIDGAATQGQYYVNNIMDPDGNITLAKESADTTGYIAIYAPGMTEFEFSVSIAGGEDDSAKVSFENTSFTTEYMATADCGDTKGYIFYDGVNLESIASGLNPGSTARADWVFKLTYSDGSQRTHYAYSTLYSPHRSVGAVSESRRSGTYNNEISSWISGINGIGNGEFSPIVTGNGDKTTQGYFKYDPLVYGLQGGSSESSDDYVTASSTDLYVEAKATNGADWTRAVGYLGYLTIDSSRYTNTNQIPNLKIGADALRVNESKKDSLGTYKAWYVFGDNSYTIGTDEDSSPSGWTEFLSLSEPQTTSRNAKIPEVNVSEINGKYIHTVSQGWCTYTSSKNYATACASVLCTTVDKSTLRDLVIGGSGLEDKNYTTDSWNNYYSALQAAADVLGNPAASADAITTATNELLSKVAQLQTVVTLNANGGNLATTQFNATVGDSVMPYYDLSAYIPVREGYTFVGWSTDANATEGSDPVKAGLMPTLYAVWEANDYVLKFDNLFSAYEYSQHPGGMTANNTTATISYENGAITVKSNGAVDANGAAKTDIHSNCGYGDNYYNIAVKGSTEYVFEYDVVTDYGSQLHLFMYDIESNDYTSNGWLQPSERSWVFTDASSSKETRGTYPNGDAYKHMYKYTNQNGSGHVVLRFTTHANADVITFRFGNKDNNMATSTFSNIRFIEASKYDASIEYEAPKTEDVFVYGSTYGELPEPTRPGYTFNAWLLDGTAITSSTSVAAEHKTAYSEWLPNTYKLTYNLDGGTMSESVTREYNMAEPFTVPTPTKDDYIFVFWKVTATDGNWTVDGIVNGGDVVSGLYGNTTLTAIYTLNAYTVEFNANGGSGSMDFQTINYNTATNLAANTFTKTGYTFVGWNTKADGSGTSYEEGETVRQLADAGEIVTLYAQWTINDSALVADTIVVDFGLPITFKPFDNDTILVNELLSYSGYKYKFIGLSTDGGEIYSTTPKGKYGDFYVDTEALNVTYTPSGVMNGAEETVYYCAEIIKDDTKIATVKNTITIAPASNVYYEESVINPAKAASDTLTDWDVIGTASTNQDESTTADVYGYDNSYSSSANFSNNTHYEVNTDSIDKRSETATFEFTGTGFDLIAACGYDTGVQLVNIKDSDGNMVKGYIVDTYYNIKEDNPLITSGLLYQVPIVNWSGEHGTYTVEVTAYYLGSAGALKKSSIKNNLIDTGLVMNSAKAENTSDVEAIFEAAGIEDVSAEDVELIWFDDNSVLNGGTGANGKSTGARTQTDDNGKPILENYVDGIRVYNPLGSEDKYYSTNEKNPVYANVVNTLVESGSNVGGIAYITDGTTDGLTWAEYQAKGPKGEIYLNGNSNISFNVNLDSGERVMLGLRAVNGATNVTISSDTGTENVEYAVGSATEMYYDITKCLGTISAADSSVTITVANTGSTILAVNHVKFSGSDNSNTTVGAGSARSISRSGDTATEVTADKFIALTADDLIEIQNNLAKETVPGIVENGLVVPLIEEDNTEGDNTETTTPDDGNTDVTEPEGGNTDTTEPEGGNTETTEPEDGNTDVTEPEEDNTETTEPDSGNTDVTEPEEDNTETTEPDSGNTDVTEPEEDNTDTTEPEGGNTDTTEPEEDNTETTEPDSEGGNNASGGSGSSGSSNGIFDLLSIFKKLFDLIKKIFSFSTIK